MAEGVPVPPVAEAGAAGPTINSAVKFTAEGAGFAAVASNINDIGGMLTRLAQNPAAGAMIGQQISSRYLVPALTKYLGMPTTAGGFVTAGVTSIGAYMAQMSKQIAEQRKGMDEIIVKTFKNPALSYNSKQFEYYMHGVSGVSSQYDESIQKSTKSTFDALWEDTTTVASLMGPNGDLSKAQDVFQQLSLQIAILGKSMGTDLTPQIQRMNHEFGMSSIEAVKYIANMGEMAEQSRVPMEALQETINAVYSASREAGGTYEGAMNAARFLVRGPEDLDRFAKLGLSNRDIGGFASSTTDIYNKPGISRERAIRRNMLTPQMLAGLSPETRAAIKANPSLQNLDPTAAMELELAMASKFDMTSELGQERYMKTMGVSGQFTMSVMKLLKSGRLQNIPGDFQFTPDYLQNRVARTSDATKYAGYENITGKMGAMFHTLRTRGIPLPTGGYSMGGYVPPAGGDQSHAYLRIWPWMGRDRENRFKESVGQPATTNQQLMDILSNTKAGSQEILIKLDPYAAGIIDAAITGKTGAGIYKR